MEILEPMFESMDIEKDQKVELQEAFDKAVLVKTTEMLDEHVDTKVLEKVEVLEEEYQEKVSLLEDSLDGYLDTVVENFITENAPSYEAQIDQEKTKSLLELFDRMAEVIGVDMLSIQEAKEVKDADIVERDETMIQKLEDNMADMADKLVESKREADKYLEAGLVNEMTEGLTILEAAKFEKLAEMVNFERTPAFMDKLEVIKEQIVSVRADDFVPSDLPVGAFKAPELVDVKSATDFSKYI